MNEPRALQLTPQFDHLVTHGDSRYCRLSDTVDLIFCPITLATLLVTCTYPTQRTVLGVLNYPEHTTSPTIPLKNLRGLIRILDVLKPIPGNSIGHIQPESFQLDRRPSSYSSCYFSHFISLLKQSNPAHAHLRTFQSICPRCHSQELSLRGVGSSP